MFFFSAHHKMLIAFNKESHIQTFLLTSSPRNKNSTNRNVVEIKLNNSFLVRMKMAYDVGCVNGVEG